MTSRFYINGYFFIIISTILLNGCATLPVNNDMQASYALTNTAETTLGKAVADELKSNPGLSGFYLLSSGLDAFAARALMANSAEHSIDAQYYLLHDDMVGLLFLSSLLTAADRGVRVRLLVDDMALNDRKDLGMAALNAHPQVEIRVFNPFTRKSSRILQILTHFDDVTRRMHNKSFTVDNQIAVVGGRNIGNEYFEADPDLAFGDLDLLAVGPVVKEISASFDKYWNSDRSYPIALLLGHSEPSKGLDKLRDALTEFVAQQHDSDYLQALRKSDLISNIKHGKLELDWGTAHILYDDPAKVTSGRDQTDLHLSTQLAPLISRVKHEMTIFSPYFIPGRKGVENLEKLRSQGVRVRILTNSLASTDVSAVHAGYSKYRKYLLRAGVELYEVDNTLTSEQRKKNKGSEGSSKASLHAKSFVLDSQEVFIGSLNLDPRSLVENTEIGLYLESEDIALEMNEWFDQNIDNVAFRLKLETDARGNEILVWYRKQGNEEIRYTTEPNTSFWRRFGVGFLKILPIESLL